MPWNLFLLRDGCYNLLQISDNLEAIRVAELLLVARVSEWCAAARWARTPGCRDCVSSGAWQVSEDVPPRMLQREG